jgi:hypothetical protein
MHLNRYAMFYNTELLYLLYYYVHGIKFTCFKNSTKKMKEEIWVFLLYV